MTDTRKKTKLSHHDRYFRKAMSIPEVAKEFLQANLPNTFKNAVNYDTLRIENGSYVEESLRMQVVDTLLSAEIEGEKGYIYILCEHASTPDKWLPLRMIKYMIAILDDLKSKGPKAQEPKGKRSQAPLPLIVPLIFYTGSQKYTSSLDFFDLFGDRKAWAKDFFLNPCAMTDLSHVRDEDLTQTFYGPMARLMKHIYDRELNEHIGACLHLLDKIQGEKRLDFILASVSYIIEGRRGEDFERLGKVIKQNLSPSINEVVMRTIADIFREEGMEKGKSLGLQEGKSLGLQEGKSLGLQEGRREVAEKMLQRGMSYEDVSDIMNLSLRDLQTLLGKPSN